MIFNNNTITLNSKAYNVVDSASVKIADSFVATPNKVGKGSGEARLYVSSQSTEPIFKFSNTEILTRNKKSYHLCSYPCFINKDNLLKYLEDAHLDYLNPKQNHRENISLLYDERLDLVSNLTEETYFKIFNQNGDLDSHRFYIGCVESAWDIIRNISLPKVTTLNIYKLINTESSDDVLFYFELIYDNSKSKEIKYSRRKLENEVVEKIKNDTNIDTTEKTSLIKSRKGQGKFRSNVLSIMPSCPFTNISLTSLLRASHIMPWSKCETNTQRLDGYNGLSLTPTYDVLFDSGLISFNNDGSLLISSRLSNDIRSSLNLVEGKVYNIENESGNKDFYLDYHRCNVFSK